MRPVLLQHAPSTSCGCGRRAVATAAPPAASGRGRRRTPIAAASSGPGGASDAFADVKRIAKKIQGALPIVGLLSRLSAPSGGFDEISYPEFCRSAFDTATPNVREAVYEMERRFGKLGQTRWLYLMLWMARHGNGLVPPKNIITAAKRLRVTQDVEIEMDRFENARDATLAKYRIARPKGKVSEGLDLAVDAIAILCMGLAEGAAVPEADETMLADILGWVFPEASREEVQGSIRARPGRLSAYQGS